MESWHLRSGARNTFPPCSVEARNSLSTPTKSRNENHESPQQFHRHIPWHLAASAPQSQQLGPSSAAGELQRLWSSARNVGPANACTLRRRLYAEVQGHCRGCPVQLLQYCQKCLWQFGDVELAFCTSATARFLDRSSNPVYV